MTPFGQAIRKLRLERNITQKDMAAALGVSAAYLSALEHGHRSKPSWQFVQRIIGYFNIIWDDAENLMTLAGVSNPKITIDTSGLDPKATEIANLLAHNIRDLSPYHIEQISNVIKQSIMDRKYRASNITNIGEKLPR